MHVQSCCFANLNQLIFAVLVAVAVVFALAHLYVTNNDNVQSAQSPFNIL